MSGAEVIQRDPRRELTSQLRNETFLQQVQIALPGNVSPQRFQRAAVTAILTNPDLVDAANANPDAFFASLIRCAQDGLLPDAKEAAIVVYRVKGTPTPTYIPMVGGFRKIAGEQGWSIRARVVFEHDEFEYEEGLEPKLRHIPASGDRGDMIKAYAVATHASGQREVRVMSAADIAKRRKVSRAADRGPWVEWEEQMWEKTVARDLFQDLPLGDRERVNRVLAVDAQQATELLYGRNGSPALEAPADGPADPAGTSQDATAEPSDRAASETGTAEAEASGDDDEPGPEAAHREGNGAASAEAHEKAEAAGKVVIPSGQWKGKTIAEVAAHENGAAWFNWLLVKADQVRRDETHKEHLIYLAAEAYAAAHMPGLLA